MQKSTYIFMKIQWHEKKNDPVARKKIDMEEKERREKRKKIMEALETH